MKKWSGQGDWQVELENPMWFITVLEAFGLKFNIVADLKKIIAQGFTERDKPWIYPSEIGVGDIFGVAGTTLSALGIRSITGRIAHLGLANGGNEFYEALKDGMSLSNLMNIRVDGGDVIAFFRVFTDDTTKVNAVERAKFRVGRYKYSLGKALAAGCYSPTGFVICNASVPLTFGYVGGGGSDISLGRLVGAWAKQDDKNFGNQPREFCSEAVYNCYHEAGLNLIGSPAFAYPNTITQTPFAECYGYLPKFVDLSGKMQPKQ